MMKMIVAADRNWGIGLRGELLVSIPNDMKFFREKTMGHVIVMGRHTLESFPGGRPLRGRRNVVLTRREDFCPDGVETVHSTGELLRFLNGSCAGEDVFCIGGASVYRQLLPLTDLVYVTRIDRAYQADVYFPDLDADPAFALTDESDEMTYFDMTYHFDTYERVNL